MFLIHHLKLGREMKIEEKNTNSLCQCVNQYGKHMGTLFLSLIKQT